MTEQMIVALCAVWMLNGFVLGIYALEWYKNRQDRINGESK